MTNDLLLGISQLSVRMRLLRAHYAATSSVAELNDRQVLLLEILADQGSMSVTDLTKRFRGVAQSTISSDIKGLRSADKRLLEVQLDQHDMRKHIVALTEAGQNKVLEVRRQRAQTFAPLARALPKEPAASQMLDNVVRDAIRFIDEVLASVNDEPG